MKLLAKLLFAVVVFYIAVRACNHKRYEVMVIAGPDGMAIIKVDTETGAVSTLTPQDPPPAHVPGPGSSKSLTF